MVAACLGKSIGTGGNGVCPVQIWQVAVVIQQEGLHGNGRPRLDEVANRVAVCEFIEHLAHGVGQRFNLGEMTVSRCVVALDGSNAMGVGYVQGRDRRRAELVAVFDALSQDTAGAEQIEQLLIAPVERKLADERRARDAKVAATKVDFFTLVRGED